MSGAKTPLSKFVTMCIVLLALSSLTTSFYYIPQAALSAVIFVSINSLVNVRFVVLPHCLIVSLSYPNLSLWSNPLLCHNTCHIDVRYVVLPHCLIVPVS